MILRLKGQIDFRNEFYEYVMTLPVKRGEILSGRKIPCSVWRASHSSRLLLASLDALSSYCFHAA